MSRTFIYVEEGRIRTFVTNAPGSVSDGYAGNICDDGRIDRLGVLKERFDAYEKLKTFC